MRRNCVCIGEDLFTLVHKNKELSLLTRVGLHEKCEYH